VSPHRAGIARIRSPEAIADRLRATRRALGLNQRQLCERAGLLPQTYNQWEKAKGRPDLDGALALCDAFNLSLDWIYRGDPSQLPFKIAIHVAGSRDGKDDAPGFEVSPARKRTPTKRTASTPPRRRRA
jgi:transcriptional regulator with XRE-family HTH domain